MRDTPINLRRAVLRGLGISLALALPASASAESDVSFATSFAGVGAPASHVPAADAVDITAIDPADDAGAQPQPGLGSGIGIGGGVASYYADKFNGRRTASGEAFSNAALTAAHRTLPFGTRLLVTNPANGKSVVVRVNDRGPFHGSRVLDLSKSAASRLGLVARGSGRVELARID